MIKIGLLGTQSFHAAAFTKLCNLPDENGKYLFDDVRITAVCGDDDTKEHLDTVVSDGKVETVVETKEELSEIVDAVMILYRKGSEHLESAVYFLKKGIPVWLDKPLCSSIEDAVELKKAVEETKTLFSGGSTLRYSKDVLEAIEAVKTEDLGNICGGVVNHHGSLESPYDGLYFYSPHVVEQMLDIFGYKPVSVKATVFAHDNITVAVKYEDKLINLNINNGVPYLMVYGDKNVYTKHLKSDDCYKGGFTAFVAELKKEKEPVPFDDMIKSIYVISAILESVDKNEEVFIK